MALAVEFRLEDGKTVKVFSPEEMSEEETAGRLLMLDVGDTVLLGAAGEEREFVILGMERRELFQLQLRADEQLTAIVFIVRPQSDNERRSA